MKKVVLCFDLDNVICKTNKKFEYAKSTPNKKQIKLINKLYEKGYYIKVFTARGSGRFEGNLKKIKKKFLKLTLRQFKIWKLSYHEFIIGKPSYDLFVDDKCYGFKKDWHKNFDEYLKKKNLHLNE